MGNSATREKISTQQRHERDDRNVGGTEASTPPIPESWVQNDSNSLYFVTPTDVRLEFGGKNLEFEIVGSTGDPVGQQIRDGRGLKSDSSRFTENSTGVGETFKRPTNQCETPTLQSGTTRGHLVTTESDCIRSPLSSFTAGRHDCWSNGWEKTGNFTGRDCRYSYGSDVRYRVDIINRTKDWPNPYSRKELLTAPRQNAAVFTHLDIGGINDCNLSQSHLADNKVATQSLPNLSFTHTSFNPPLSLKFVALRRKSMELHSAGPFRSNEESIKRSKLTLPLTSPMANDSGFVYTTLRAKTPQQTSNSGKFTPFSQEACVAKGDNNSFSVEKGQRRRQPLLYRNPSLPKSTIKPSCEPNNNERFEEKDIFTG